MRVTVLWLSTYGLERIEAVAGGPAKVAELILAFEDVPGVEFSGYSFSDDCTRATINLRASSQNATTVGRARENLEGIIRALC